MSVSTYWADLATAANDTIAVGFAASTRHSWSAISLTNAGLGSGNLENIVTANGSGATPRSATATPGAGTTDRLLVGLSGSVQSANATGSLAAAPGNSETERIETELAGGASARAVGSQIETYDSSASRAVTTTWSKTSATIQWAHVALGVKGEVSPTTALNTPADAATGQSTTPTLNFTGTDGNADTVEYEVQIDTSNTFNSQSGLPLIDALSSTNVGFENTTPIFSDNFDDNSIDGAKWTTYVTGTSTVVESGGKIIITPQSSAISKGILYSNSKYDFTGNAAIIRMLQSGSNTTNSGFRLYLDTNNYIEIGNYGGTLEFGYNLSGSWTSVASAAYNNSTHRWLRLRESGGTVYCDYSADGVTWTNLGSVAKPIAVTSLEVDIFCEEYTSTATPGAAWFDDFSIMDFHPFTSGEDIDYTVQSVLSAGTYYWRARAIDPLGSNTWGVWATSRSFTIESGVYIPRDGIFDFR